jgi:hypothetical protein
MKSSVQSLINFVSLFCQLQTSETPSILRCNCQYWNSTQFYFQLHEILVIKPKGRPSRKHRFLYCCLLIHCCRNVFTAPLHSNDRGADHRKHRSFFVARFGFREYVFTDLLPSNKLFRLSSIMSQYTECKEICFNALW